MTRRRTGRRRKGPSGTGSKATSPETARKIAQTLKDKVTLTREQKIARVPNKEYLNTAEVAHVFDVHEYTVYKWKRQDRLQAFRTRAGGKAHVYRREDVLALIEKQHRPMPVRSTSEQATGGGAQASQVDRVAGERLRGKVKRRTPKGPGRQG